MKEKLYWHTFTPCRLLGGAGNVKSVKHTWFQGYKTLPIYRVQDYLHLRAQAETLLLELALDYFQGRSHFLLLQTHILAKSSWAETLEGASLRNLTRFLAILVPKERLDSLDRSLKNCCTNSHFLLVFVMWPSLWHAKLRRKLSLQTKKSRKRRCNLRRKMHFKDPVIDYVMLCMSSAWAESKRTWQQLGLKALASRPEVLCSSRIAWTVQPDSWLHNCCITLCNGISR